MLVEVVFQLSSSVRHKSRDLVWFSAFTDRDTDRYVLLNLRAFVGHDSEHALL